MTLIDKAEALAIVNGYWQTIGGRLPEGPSDEAILDALDALSERLAALPERGVGVPTDVKDYATDVSEAYDTMMEVERNPAGAWQVIQALAGHIAALEPVQKLHTLPAPTDAAKAAAQADYEARIRAATEYTLAPHLQKIVDGAKTAPQWDTQADRLAPTDADSKPVWPDFIAPPKYENPDPRWVDPALPDFRLIWKVARECGYAVGLHGSMKRDCDLIAVPWTDNAVLAFDLIYRLCEALNAQVVGPVAGKPHGRLGWNLQVDGYVKVIDISVVPRNRDRLTETATTEELK